MAPFTPFAPVGPVGPVGPLQCGTPVAATQRAVNQPGVSASWYQTVFPSTGVPTSQHRMLTLAPNGNEPRTAESVEGC
ncbi:hypothetical protein [Streptomyces sp. NPDC001508]|uniref:hypothetical protein n=1 Tax=Streptomyces sp. NPDC001508 TaxID=3154656 RepID=UPI003325CD9A